MATFTPNYNLRKPATTDFVNVTTDINDNMDKIDTEMKLRKDKTDSFETAWGAWTPTLTNWVLGNGVITAAFKQIGKTVKARAVIEAGSTTTFAGSFEMSLPVSARSFPQIGGTFIGIGHASLRDVSVPGSFNATVTLINQAVNISIPSATGNSQLVTGTFPFTFASGDFLILHFDYEAA